MSTLDDLRDRCNQQLAQLLNQPREIPSQLIPAIKYTSLDAGKRLRPVLAYLIGELLDCPLERLDIPVCAIELVHCYSLVHDDLPCMDDASLRRGKPSTHCAFDEATAVLVGDGLQSLAFELIASAENLSYAQRLGMITQLAKAIGFSGMVGGQYLDINPPADTSSGMVQHIHHLKTGQLIACAVEFSIIAAQSPNQAAVDTVRQFARNFGLAYQAQDDFLDSAGHAKELGKPIHQDREKYPGAPILTIEESKAKVEQLYQAIMDSLAQLGARSQPLIAFTQSVRQRNR